VLLPAEQAYPHALPQPVVEPNVQFIVVDPLLVHVGVTEVIVGACGGPSTQAQATILLAPHAFTGSTQVIGQVLSELQVHVSVRVFELPQFVEQAPGVHVAVRVPDPVHSSAVSHGFVVSHPVFV